MARVYVIFTPPVQNGTLLCILELRARRHVQLETPIGGRPASERASWKQRSDREGPRRGPLGSLPTESDYSTSGFSCGRSLQFTDSLVTPHLGRQGCSL